MVKITIFILIFVIILILGVVGYLYLRPTDIQLKCPEDYATEDEAMAELEIVLRKETDNNPSLTAEEMYGKRYDFLVAHHCEKTLQNLKDHLPPESTGTKEEIIQSEMRIYNEGDSASTTTE